MAYASLDELFDAICNSIRAKDGSTGLIKHQDIPGRIDTMYNDANATEEDILKDKIAYVNGKKVIGIHECYELMATSLDKIHIWERYTAVTKYMLNETEKTKVELSYRNATSSDMDDWDWDKVKYSDEMKVFSGEIKLINPSSMILNKEADRAALLGKYVYSGNTSKYYRIPSDTSIRYVTKEYMPSEWMVVDVAMELSVTSEEVDGGGAFAGYVVSSDKTAYPTNGIYGDFDYVYIGTCDNTDGANLGDATASDVMAGKTFTSSNGTMLTGTHNCDGGVDTSDATATPEQILKGATAYVKGEKITGIHECDGVNLQTKTVAPTKSVQNVSPDSGYNGMSQVTVNAIPDNYIDTSDADANAENIAKGKTAYVGGAKITGTHECSEGLDTSDATATEDRIESGYTAYVNGTKIEGTLESTTSLYNTVFVPTNTSNDGTASYLEETGVGLVDKPARIEISFDYEEKSIIKGTPNNPATVKATARAKEFGDATAEDVVAGKTFTSINGLKITGTHECISSEPLLQSKSITPSETAQTVTPDSGYDGLSEVSVGEISNTYVGSGITKKSAATYTPGTSNQTIESGQYLDGVQTIKGDSNLVVGNIKKGVSIFGVSGSYEASSSGESSGGLKMVTGSLTATGSNDVIDTGLSTIKQFVLYNRNISSTGMVQASYNEELGTSYVYCSSYSTYMKSFAVSSTAPTIDGGRVTWNKSGNMALASNGQYYWIAVGEE